MGLKRRNPARTRQFTQILTAPAAAPAAPAAAAPRAAPPAAPVRAVSREERHRMIAAAAWGHAERSGFATDPVANWLVAEREIDDQLARLAS